MGHPSPALVAIYDLGDMVTLRATVLGTDGQTPVAPSSFEFRLMNPAGVVATYVFGQAGASIVSPGAGAFFKDVSITPTILSVGSWYYWSLATGLVQAADVWSFMVAPNAFTF